MTWFKIDDSFWGHPKRVATPPAALGVWVTAGSWCAQQLTDGKVPAHMLALFAGRPEDADNLVQSGLWETLEDGWLFHDWHDWQPSRAQVQEKRDAEARRKQEWRDKKKARRDSPELVPPGQDADATRDKNVARRGTDADVLSTRPDPTRPDPTEVPKGTSRDSAPRKRATPAPDIFPITDDMRQWAADNSVPGDLDDETANFLDHHRAKGSTFKDWPSAWRTWMRNSRKFTPAPTVRQSPGYKPSEAWMHQYDRGAS